MVFVSVQIKLFEWFELGVVYDDWLGACGREQSVMQQVTHRIVCDRQRPPVKTEIPK